MKVTSLCFDCSPSKSLNLTQLDQAVDRFEVPDPIVVMSRSALRTDPLLVAVMLGGTGKEKERQSRTRRRCRRAGSVSSVSSRWTAGSCASAVSSSSPPPCPSCT